MYLLNPLLPIGAPAPKRRDKGYSNDALKAKRKVNGKRKAETAPPLASKVVQVSKTGRRKSPANLWKAAAPVPLPPLKRKRQAPKRKAAAAAEQTMATMAEQLAAADRDEAEAQQQEAQRQAEAEAAALHLAVMREETLHLLAEHRKQVAADEAVAAEAARTAAAAAQQHSVEDARVRDLDAIEQQVKAFHAAFKQEHKRAPKRADLELAVNVRMKVAVERYHLLKHGQAPSGLQGGRDRSRAFQHRF
jgi:hypothetical protein